MTFEEWQALQAKGFFDGRFKSIGDYDKSYREAINTINGGQAQMQQLQTQLMAAQQQLQMYQGIEEAYTQVAQYGIQSGFLKDNGQEYEFVQPGGQQQTQQGQQGQMAGQQGQQMGQQMQPGQQGQMMMTPQGPQYVTPEMLQEQFTVFGQKMLAPLAQQMMGTQIDNVIMQYLMQVPEASPYQQDLRITLMDMASRGENINNLQVVDQTARAVAAYRSVNPVQQPQQAGQQGMMQFGQQAPAQQTQQEFQPFPQFAQPEQEQSQLRQPRGQGMQGQGFSGRTAMQAAPVIDFAGGKNRGARQMGRQKAPGEDTVRQGMGIDTKDWEQQADALAKGDKLSLEDELPTGGEK